MISEFYGNQICCGTYAFLNLTNDSSIDADLFEISTSVPFGIVHKRYPRFDHLLTPICDPNMGLDRAIAAWGYEAEHHVFVSGAQVARYLQCECRTEEKVMIGPVDMGRLYYQPLVSLYRHLDHYIVAVKLSKDRVEISDSEGIISERCDPETLGRILSVKDLPEAKGGIHIRKAVQGKKRSVSEIIKSSLSLAGQNIAASVMAKEEEKPFQRCRQFLLDVPMFQWRGALLYDLSYIMQRKLLHKKLGEYAVIYGHWQQEKLDALLKIIGQQMGLLGQMFSDLRYGESMSEEQCSELDLLEENLLCILMER